MKVQPKKSALILLCLLSLFSMTLKSSCVLYQETTTSKLRVTMTDDEKTPKAYTEDMDICPEFFGKEVCCTPSARTIMAANFVKFDLASPCQTCGNNMRRFL